MEKRKLFFMVFSLWIVIVAGAVCGLALHKDIPVENYAVYSYRRGMKLVDLDIAPTRGITFFPDPISLPELEEFMVQDAVDSFSGQLLVLSDNSSVESKKVCGLEVERGKIVAVVMDPAATLEQKSAVKSYQGRILSSLAIPSASLRIKWVKGSPAEIPPQAFYTSPDAQRHYDGSIGFDTNARIQGVRIFLDIENGIVVAVRTPRL